MEYRCGKCDENDPCRLTVKESKSHPSDCPWGQHPLDVRWEQVEVIKPKEAE